MATRTIEQFHSLRGAYRYLGMFDHLYSDRYPDEKLAAWCKEQITSLGWIEDIDRDGSLFTNLAPIVMINDCIMSFLQKLAVRGDLMVMFTVRFIMIFKLMPRFIGRYMARKASPTYPDDEIIPWVNSKKRLSFDFLASMSALEMDLSAPFEVIRKINVPILLFIGDREKMSIMSKDAAQKALESNEKVKGIHLAGASRDIRRTRFDGYMPALKDFLEVVR